MLLSLYANHRGEVLEHPDFFMLGRSGDHWLVPEPNEIMPLPRGSSLVAIPGTIPAGLNHSDEVAAFECDPADPAGQVQAVAALLPQGFTRTLLPACVSKDSRELPLLGYAAVGLKAGKIYVAAVQTDEHHKWHPVNYNTEGLPARINKVLKRFPDNRIYRQLAHCSLRYGCFTAQNIFYQRWEGGIPSMTKCNAECLGCISESHSKVESAQQRIDFLPSTEEIAQVGLEHLQHAKEGIISFGQGCEGEPSLNAKRLAAAIRIIRTETGQGTININTNAGYTTGIKSLCDAGLDSMRVTLFSCREENYRNYHRPINYEFSDVCNSINYARDHGISVSLNLLVFPGFTDREEEIEALLALVKKQRINMIQMRNLNIDPDRLLANVSVGGEALGIVNFLALLQEELPEVTLGSYSHPVRRDLT